MRAPALPRGFPQYRVLPVEEERRRAGHKYRVLVRGAWYEAECPPRRRA